MGNQSFTTADETEARYVLNLLEALCLEIGLSCIWDLQCFNNLSAIS